MEVNSRARRNALLFLSIAGIILWIPLVSLLLNRSPGFLRDLGFLSGPGGTPLAWILALFVAAIYAAFTIRNIPIVHQYWRALSLLKLYVVVIAVAAAIVEEAFFRRLVMDWVLAAGGGDLAQVLASGLVFGLAHGIWGIVTGRIAVGIGTVIATGTLGVALGIVYLVGGRSLAPPIVSHSLITAAIQPGIMFAAFSGQVHKPA